MRGRHIAAVAAAAAAVTLAGASASPAVTVTVDAGASRATATVSPEFLSFGIDASQMLTRGGGTPFDFTRARLRRLTAPLSPALIRFSGTKIDSTNIDLTGADPPVIPPGYKYGITRAEWDAANGFAKDLGLGVVLGLNDGPGPRTASGAWDPMSATALLTYAAAHGFPVRATSFGNEPNIAYYGAGLPSSYSAADYAGDATQAAALSRRLLPHALVIGPGSFFSEGAERPLNGLVLGPDTSDIMPAAKGLYDAVSYHSYPAFADTCALPIRPVLPADTLSAEFLDRVNGPLAYMSGLRDANDPGRPLWVDESGSAACGGVVGFSDRFAASFYYLNFLGTLARSGVQVAIRWTLSGPPSQPYSLIDDSTLTPRPDYWAAVLWHRLMGRTVLAPRAVGAPSPTLRTFAACTPGTRGGVTTLALNTDRTGPAQLRLAGAGAQGARAYVVTGALDSAQPLLNGTPLTVAADGSVPALSPVAVSGGALTIPAASYAFVTAPLAASRPCHARVTRVGLRVPRQRLATVKRTRSILAFCRLRAAGTCTVTARGPLGRRRVPVILGSATISSRRSGLRLVRIGLSGVAVDRLVSAHDPVRVGIHALGVSPGRTASRRARRITLR